MNNHSIAILYQDEAGNGLTHEFFAAILDSFKTTVEEQGYEITFINSRRHLADGPRYLEHIKSRGFDGVAAICTDFKSEEIIEVIESDLPVVTIDEAISGVPSVLSDNAQGIRNLVYYIAEMGHKKIAYIYGDMNTVTSLRITNFVEACAEMGIEVPKDYLRASHYRDLYKTGFETECLLRLPDPPSCIIYPDDYAAIGAINVLKARGLVIPDDISIAAYDGLDIPSHYDPQITTVKQDTESIGRIAAMKLIDQIENPQSADLNDVRVDTTLVKGATIRKIYI